MIDTLIRIMPLVNFSVVLYKEHFRVVPNI